MTHSGMKDRGWFVRNRFWALALLWLPAVMVGNEMVRFFAIGGASVDGLWVTATVRAASSLVMVAPCGLPLAAVCRRLRRHGYRRGARLAGWVVVVLTVAAAGTPAGMLGPLSIAVYGLVFTGIVAIGAGLLLHLAWQRRLARGPMRP